MKVANDHVVLIHYTLKDEQGNLVDSSKGGEPLKYLHGAGNIIPGLEKALLGCAVGDNKEVIVEPSDGYGEYDESLVSKIPREFFSGVDVIQEGMEFHAQGPNGEVQPVIVKAVAETEVTIDANHELAGQTLCFQVSIEDVRLATSEEIDHGHVH